MSGLDIAGLVVAVAGITGDIVIKAHDFKNRMKDYDQELENLAALCRSIEQDVKIVESEIEDGALPGSQAGGDDERPTYIDGIRSSMEELKVLLDQLNDELERLNNKDTSTRAGKISAQKQFDERIPIIERIQNKIDHYSSRLHFYLWRYEKQHRPDNPPVSKPVDNVIALFSSNSHSSSETARSHSGSASSSRQNSPNSAAKQESEVIRACKKLDIEALQPVLNENTAQEKDEVGRTPVDIVITQHGTNSGHPQLLDMVELLLNYGSQFTSKDEEKYKRYCDIKSAVDDRRKKRENSRRTGRIES